MIWELLFAAAIAEDICNASMNDYYDEIDDLRDEIEDLKEELKTLRLEKEFLLDDIDSY
ncbi:hypothetical protein IJ843_00060 [bacterium]|nr:hypothetical protein [bacterium]